jgi:hypothetical protein
MGTTLTRVSLAACLLAAAASSVFAQDQTLIVAAPPAICKVTPPDPLLFKEEDAAAFITRITGKDPETDLYYLIHSVKFAGSGMTIGEQKWFVYHRPWHLGKGFLAQWTDSRVRKHFEEARVFGSRKLALVYALSGVPVAERAGVEKETLGAFRRFNGVSGEKLASGEKEVPLSAKTSRAELEREVQLGARYLPDDGQRRLNRLAGAGPSASDADLAQALAQVQAENLMLKEFDGVAAASGYNLTDRASGERLVPLAPDLLTTQTFTSLRELHYRVDVTKKEPAPAANLKGLVRVIFAQATSKDVPVRTATASICGLAPFSIEPLPSDMKVTSIAQDGEDQKELGKQIFDNERKYWFDVSFALPLKSYNDLSVDVDAGQVGAKKVEKTDLYAAVNVSPVPYDTKKPHVHLIPSLVYGMPITGKPLKRHLVGVSIGLTRAQIFAGVLFSREEAVTAASAGGVTTAVVAHPERWTRTFSWGLNLSVRTITDLFKKE